MVVIATLLFILGHNAFVESPAFLWHLLHIFSECFFSRFVWFLLFSENVTKRLFGIKSIQLAIQGTQIWRAKEMLSHSKSNISLIRLRQTLFFACDRHVIALISLSLRSIYCWYTWYIYQYYIEWMPFWQNVKFEQEQSRVAWVFVLVLLMNTKTLFSEWWW